MCSDDARNTSEMAMPAARFVALGGVWLDEIRTVGKATRYDVIGGSVPFATLGARLFAATDTTSIRLVCRIGNDEFPQGIISTFREWKSSLSLHYSDSLPSARGVVQYDGVDESRRTYQRLTSPLLTTWQHLTASDVFNATCFHLFETPDSAEEQIREILLQRRDLTHPPLFVWEPQAKSCNIETLDRHLKVASLVDVFSPNHAELCSLFDEHVDLVVDKSRIEAQANYFIDVGVGPNKKGCVVVRCAEHGCLVMSAGMVPTWLPAFYNAGSERVIDATGGGNAFLGGFGIGYQETGSFVKAAQYGNVAASFVIEQVGVPNVSGEGANELWNGVRVRDRLAAYETRIVDQ